MQEWLETCLPNVADSFPVLQQSILETLQMVLAAGLISFFLACFSVRF